MTVAGPTETKLAEDLAACFAAFREASDLEDSTIAQYAAGDWRFFDRLRQGDSTFTVRKYDQVIGWFSDNWPARTAWPKGVYRPKQKAGPA